MAAIDNERAEITTTRAREAIVLDALVRMRDGDFSALPIIALTAHAMREDRDRCLAAGMDGYVAKPLDEEELRAAMHSLLHSPAEEDEPAAPVPPFDAAVLLRDYATQPAFLIKLIDVFRSALPRQIENLAEAVRLRDPALLHRSAHTIRGSVGTVNAKRAMELAAELERIAREGGMNGTESLLASLEHEVGRVLDALDSMRTEVA